MSSGTTPWSQEPTEADDQVWSIRPSVRLCLPRILALLTLHRSVAARPRAGGARRRLRARAGWCGWCGAGPRVPPRRSEPQGPLHVHERACACVSCPPPLPLITRVVLTPFRLLTSAVGCWCAEKVHKISLASLQGEVTQKELMELMDDDLGAARRSASATLLARKSDHAAAQTASSVASSMARSGHRCCFFA